MASVYLEIVSDMVTEMLSEQEMESGMRLES